MSRSATEEPDTAQERDAAGPRSLMRLLSLFALLARTGEGLSLSQLSTALETPKSSLLNLLRPLVADQYLLHDGTAYRLGPAIFRLSAGVLSAWSFPKTIRPFMEELAERTDETVLLGVLNPEAEVITYVEAIESPHPIRYQLAAGTTRPLYASSAGRLLLAYADAAWTEQYLASLSIKKLTPEPITKTSLRRRLAEIRQAGVERSLDGYLVGLSSVAAPVFDAEGRCVASLSIAGPSNRFRDQLDELTAVVTDVAQRASGMVVSPRRR